MKKKDILMKNNTTSPSKHFFKSDVFSARFLFVFGEVDVEYLETAARKSGIMGKEDELDASKSCAGACFDLPYGCLIWMPFVPGPLTEQRTLVHEIVHAAIFTGRRLGFGDGREADEFRAYMADWLFGKICKKIW